MKPVTFTKKEKALKAQKQGQILANKNITQYFNINSLQEFLDLIKAPDSTKNYYEVISTKPVNFFFDIEIYKAKNPVEYDTCETIVQTIKETVTKTYPEYTHKFIVLESHLLKGPDDKIKKSFHLIIQMVDTDGNHVYFPNAECLKKIISEVHEFNELAHNNGILDTNVYREGLFRTIHSSKPKEKRYLIKSELSDPFTDDLETFVTYTQEPMVLQFEQQLEVMGTLTENALINTPFTDEQKKDITDFITNNYGHSPAVIRDISINVERTCILVTLHWKFCEFIKKPHKSNHQYIIIDAYSSKQKCHDSKCIDNKHNEIKSQKYPPKIIDILKIHLKDCDKQGELIEKHLPVVTNYIKTFDDKVTGLAFNKDTEKFSTEVLNTNLIGMVSGKCKECKVEHEISKSGYCAKCTICKSLFPMLQKIPNPPDISNFFVMYSQLVNNGTINIITNNYNSEGQDVNSDFLIDESIFNNSDVSLLINQILDGHKISKISELVKTLNDNFVYDDNWFLFDRNIWTVDKDNIQLRKNVLDLSKLFNKVRMFYTNKKSPVEYNNVIKNIRSLVIKLNKFGFKDEIIKEAKLYYVDSGFQSKLNCKKHLVPFGNGVYDLLTNIFRPTTKNDYVNLTVGYEYDKNQNKEEVHDFLRKVLPNEGVRHYVLKKMSECLNGDIPNTNFMMFIGDSGANGKSQLLNLMKFTMGDFGEKLEVTLITRKRNNANEANSEKVKLMNKRFAFLSEPEDGEKINIGLLKELTGQEEIVARELNERSKTFMMEAKLFLACNKLPEIRGEDSALWRRIKVVDFPSQFVDDPKAPNEYKIDRSLPTRIREDVTWKQTFMNILIEYYTKDVPEPKEVQAKTNEYKDENNEAELWFNENIIQSNGRPLLSSELNATYFTSYTNPKTIPFKKKNLLKDQFEKYISNKFKDIENKMQDTTADGVKYKGWKGLALKGDDGDGELD